MLKLFALQKSWYGEDDQKVQIFFNLVLGSAVIMTLLEIIDCIVLPQNILRWILIICLYDLVSFGVLLLIRKGLAKSASSVFIGFLILMIFGAAWSAGGIKAPVIQNIPILILGAGLILGWKRGLYIGLITSICGLGLVLAEYAGVLPATTVVHNPLSLWVSSVLCIALLALLQYISVATLDNALQKARQELGLRKKAEESLQSSEAIRKRVFESSQIPIVVIDPASSKYIDCNQAAIEIYGFSSRDEIVGKTPEHFSAPVQYDGTPSHDKARYYIDKALAEGSIVFEWKHERLNGECWDAEVHLVSFQADQRHLLQFTLIDITKRKEAETALRTSESQFRELWDATVEGITIHDNGIILEVNDAMCRMFGSTREEVVGRSMLHFMPNEMHERFLEHIALGLEGRFEIQGLRADGTKIILEVFGKKILYQGRRVRMAATRDITDRKNAEEELRESKERYKTLIENTPDIIARFDKNLRHLFVNSAVSEISSLKPDEFLGKTIQEAGFTKEQAEQRESMIRKIIDSKMPLETELVFIGMNGRHVYDWRGYPEFDSMGDVRSVLTISRNISERKRAEEALQASEELYRKLITAISDIIVRTDLEGNIVFVNETGFPSLGYTTNERILGKNIFSFISEKDKMRAHENFKKMFVGYMGTQEYTIVNENGSSVECEVNGDVLRQADGKPFGMVYTIRDLTEKKKLQSQLLQSQKMEAIGRLAGGVAHDYNNMLGVILGYAALLEIEISPESPAHSKVKSIIAAAERSANLTKQLLAFSRQQIIAPVVMNLNEELISLNRMLGRLIGEDVKLTVYQQEQLWNVKIDSTQFTQIMTNLATNARDAIINTGSIIIQTMNQHIDQKIETLHSDIVPGDYVTLSFEDSGSGMDAATLTQIFEPFFTTKPKDKGTGLGLSTVFGIVKQNNGFINVASSVGKGTSFTIYFPRYIGEVDPQTENQDDMDISGKETILVVEDEEELLALVKDLLESHGHTVLCALAPSEALAAVETTKMKIDILITDVVMPGMNGKELKERLEMIYPSLQTLFISGYTADIVAKRGVLEEGMYFLQKPFTTTALLKKVRSMIQGNSK